MYQYLLHDDIKQDWEIGFHSAVLSPGQLCQSPLDLHKKAGTGSERAPRYQPAGYFMGAVTTNLNTKTADIRKTAFIANNTELSGARPHTGLVSAHSCQVSCQCGPGPGLPGHCGGETRDLGCCDAQRRPFGLSPLIF